MPDIRRVRIVIHKIKTRFNKDTKHSLAQKKWEGVE